ncbi:MAG: hypothetical protein KGH72_00340 [Candidatus Micrarchaeota archaeon]|nr:hypothetical protein [Candidatus Micrarchaeota archaeon]
MGPRLIRVHEHPGTSGQPLREIPVEPGWGAYRDITELGSALALSSGKVVLISDLGNREQSIKQIREATEGLDPETAQRFINEAERLLRD